MSSNMCGKCVDFVWNIYICIYIYIWNVWNICGICVEYMCTMWSMYIDRCSVVNGCGIFVQCLWNMCGICVYIYLYEICRICVERLWSMCGICIYIHIYI
jgi:hypothetical protein